jgi:hypothetical protein
VAFKNSPESIDSRRPSSCNENVLPGQMELCLHLGFRVYGDIQFSVCVPSFESSPQSSLTSSLSSFFPNPPSY